MNFRLWLEIEVKGPKEDLAQAKKNSNIKGTKIPPSPISPRGLGVPLEPPKPGFSGGGKWAPPQYSPYSLGTKYKPPAFSPFSANNKWAPRQAGVFGK